MALLVRIRLLLRPWRNELAEFLGTFIMILVGNGVVAQTILSDNKSGGPLSIHLGWGAAVCLAIQVAGGVSAHLNPAVTLAMVVFDDTPLRRLPSYALAQLLGAFTAAAVVFGLYREALDAFDVANNVSRAVAGSGATAGIFATYPASLASSASSSSFPSHSSGSGGSGRQLPASTLTEVSIATCACSEILGTAVLIAGILAMGDERNAVRPNDAVAPYMVGQLVFAIGAALGWESGYAINPARDLGPRILTSCAGVFRK